MAILRTMGGDSEPHSPRSMRMIAQCFSPSLLRALVIQVPGRMAVIQPEQPQGLAVHGIGQE